ncbi:hypothetical protein [Curvivirga aplysinae]|uniref:hypothetical protein n=1 Tax=Curvivirga aplysinae TaxID=2529852 RepID=UPI0012BBFD9D|nr:hypothetical protein [Curvivirga aplysinae]MTI08615.1 hypothetical protein [Curvivirga aplysinae]
MTKLNTSSLTSKAILFAGAVTVLAACQTTTQEASNEGIDYRQARFEEVAAMRDYRDCIAEALTLDQQARTNKSAGQYIASAKMVQTCESGLGPNVAGIAVEERMRAYGLSIQNYLKGGDIAAAQKSLDNFTTAFSGKDLYYADGSSFTETMNALLNREEASSFGQFSMLNVSKDLKQEMRRKTYWSTN